MADPLTQLAGTLETAADLAQFWTLFDRGLAAQGFDFVIYVNRAADGTVTGRANFPLYQRQPAEDDPFLEWCCNSYEVTPTGPDYLSMHGHLPERARRFIQRAGAAGFRSGFGLPVKIAGGGARGGFNLGTGLPREEFEARHGHKVDALHKLCLLAHRRLDALMRDTGGTAALGELSRRERQVLERMAEGLTRPQIAAALGITAHTVSSHVKSIYAKLGVNGQVEAVRIHLTDRR